MARLKSFSQKWKDRAAWIAIVLMVSAYSAAFVVAIYKTLA